MRIKRENFGDEEASGNVKFLIVFVSIILLLMVILGTYTIMSETKDVSGDTGVSSQITGGGELKDWTIIVFINADNDLYEDGLNNINSMEVVGSTSDVNILTIFDGNSGHKDDTRIIYVVKDDDPDEINSSPIYDHDVFDGYEANMGDPKTLVNFASWCMKEYPAKHHALIIWDHGGGFLGYENGKRSSKNSSFRLKGISWDDTDEDYLTMPELRDALNEITVGGSKKLDIVGFDACLMGMMEVFYELSPYAKYAVASEEVEWSPGWPYERILRDLAENPKISPKKFAIRIVDDYGSFYGDNLNTTISAIDLDEVGPVVAAIDNFSHCLIDLLPDRGDEIKKARNETQEYYYPENIDLYHFAELIDSYVSDDEVRDAAKKVMNTIEKAVISERHSMSHIGYKEEARSVVNSHGIAIDFPKTPWLYRGYYDGEVGTLRFTADTAWDEFLHAYYSYSRNSGHAKPYLPPQD